jgi:hypothetical protein
MPKILIINECWDCPKRYFDADRASEVCDLADKVISYQQTGIPEWCPLEDAPESEG